MPAPQIPPKKARTSAPRKKTLLHHARHTILPMRANNHHPHILKREVVFCVLVFALLLEVGVLAQGLLLFKNPNFMASVLPAVVADLTNTQRTDNGLQALTISPLLSEAAQDKANDMAAKGYFSHVSPDGTLPWYWFKQVGYTYQFAGENLAINFNDSNDVVNAWMASPMHRANILKQQYTQVGIGTATGMYEGQQTTFVVQFFADPEPVGSSSGSSDVSAASGGASAAESGSVVASNGAGSGGAAKGAAANAAASAPPATELMTTSNPSAATSIPASAAGQAQPVVSTGTPTVLGVETNNTPTIVSVSGAGQPNFFQKLLASPFTTANNIFVAIGALFLAVLIAGFIYRKRLPRMTATIGGLSVVVVVLGFAILNTHFFTGGVQVDKVSNEAAVEASQAN